MSIAWANVTAIAPELSDLGGSPGNPTQVAILATVNGMLADSKWPGGQVGAADNGRAYLAAHLGTITARGGQGPGGPVSGETVGPISQQYAVPMPKDPIYGTTSYGIVYRLLIRNLAGRVGMAA